MATEFNYRRAHREWAAPRFARLSDEIKALWKLVVAASDTITQKTGTACDFVYKSREQTGSDKPEMIPSHQAIHDAIIRIDLKELCKAAIVIYYWGHWAYTEAVILHYGSMPPERFDAADDELWPARVAKKRIKELDGYPGKPKEEPRIEYVKAGPQGDENKYGATWKFRKIVEAAIRMYNWDVWPVHYEKFERDDDFKDHVPGSSYSNEELPALLSSVLPDWLSVGKCCNANYKPHVPMVGHKTMAWASKRHSATIGSDAPCSHRDCQLTIGQHTSDRVAILHINKDVKSSEINAAIGPGTKFAELLNEHKLDGVAFFETQFEIENDVKPEKDPALIWKGDKLIMASTRPAQGLTLNKEYVAASDQFPGDFETRPMVKITNDDGDVCTYHARRFKKVTVESEVTDGGES